MTNKLLIMKYLNYAIILLLICSAIYGGYAITSIVFLNKTPTIVKCEGVVLDNETNYFFSNYDDPKKIKGYSKKDIVLRYVKNKGLMPNYLGVLKFEPNNWVFMPNKSIASINQNNNNVFLPFIRSKDMKENEYEFFKSSPIHNDKLEEGLVINFPAGEKKNRLNLQILKINEKKVLKWEDEGVCTSYKIKKNDTLTIFFNPKEGLKSSTRNNFLFTNLSKATKEYKLICKGNFYGTDYFISNENGHLSINSENEFFEIENLMFSIKPIYSVWQKFLFLFYYLFLVIFSYHIFCRCYLKKHLNPLINSIAYIRVVFNIIALLGTPILYLFYNENNNSETYKLLLILVVVLLNITYYAYVIYPILKNKFGKLFLKFNNYFFKSIGKQLFKSKTSLTSKEPVSNKIIFRGKMFLHNNKNFFIVGFSIVFYLFSIYLFFKAKDERVFGLPSLHLQKLFIILVYFLFFLKPFEILFSRYIVFINYLKKTKYFKSIPYPRPINFYIIIYSLSLSLVSHDFGSVLFVMYSLFFIEIVTYRTSSKHVFMFFLVIHFFVFIFFYLFGGSRKMYRFLYSYVSPDGIILSDVNQGDKESIANFCSILKNIFIENPLGTWNDTFVLPISRSTAHSDYAFLFSTNIGGIWFLLLITLSLIILLLLITFLIKCMLLRAITNRGTVISISENKHAIILAFWCCIILIQFLNPLFTNLFIPGAILTGQPLPLISLGVYDPIFLCMFLMPIEILFRNKSYLKVKDESEINIPKVDELFFSSVELAKKFTYLIALLLLGKGIIIVFFQKDSFTIHKPLRNETDLIENISSKASNQELIVMAQEYINNNNISILNLSSRDKDFLRKIQYKYYTSKPLYFSESNEYFNDRFDVLKRMSIDSCSKYKVQIADSKIFGKVDVLRCFINGKLCEVPSNKYFNNVLSNKFSELSAILNMKLEKHISEMPKGIVGSIIVYDNNSLKPIVVSNYPNDLGLIDKPSQKLYYIASVKKPLLAFIAYKMDKKYLSKVYSNINSFDWIKVSSNKYSKDLLQDILDNNYLEFNYNLNKYFKMDFYDINSFSYSDRSIEELKKESNNAKRIEDIAIGHLQPYTLENITKVYSVIAKDIFENNNSELISILNSPLTKNGTAEIVGQAIVDEKELDINKFICKTGTYSVNSINLSSSIILSNSRYTIGINLIGKQSKNDDGKTSKFLLKEIIKILNEHHVLSDATLK